MTHQPLGATAFAWNPEVEERVRLVGAAAAVVQLHPDRASQLINQVGLRYAAGKELLQMLAEEAPLWKINE